MYGVQRIYNEECVSEWKDNHRENRNMKLMLFQSLLKYSKLLKLSLVLMINIANNGCDRGRSTNFMEPGRIRKSWEIERGYSMHNIYQLERIALRKG